MTPNDVLDALILEHMRKDHCRWTYVISNSICMAARVRYPTAQIRKRLKVLEREGKVRNLGFAGNMHEWELVR